MGQSLVRLIQADERLHLVAGLEAKGSPAIGGDIGTSAGLAPLGLAITDDPLEALAKAEAVIDFTSPPRRSNWPALPPKRALSMSSARQALALKTKQPYTRPHVMRSS
jgi:4-hydroxy-tetrahydrodipicolinate reductase